MHLNLRDFRSIALGRHMTGFLRGSVSAVSVITVTHAFVHPRAYSSDNYIIFNRMGTTVTYIDSKPVAQERNRSIKLYYF